MDRDMMGQVARVMLGPAGAEVDCDTCFDRIDRYADLAAAGADADAAVPGMRAHLYGCPACAQEYDSLRALLDDDAAR